MEIQTISNVAIVGSIFSIILSIGFPIVLMIICRKKFKARISSFFIGAATFVLFAMVLEQISHMGVLVGLGLNAKSNKWLYYIYAASAAAVFEETGRIIAMKYFMKKRCDFPNAFMYGIGHGGIEAIIIGGISSINNLVSMLMINSGMMQASLSGLSDEVRNKTITRLSALWTTPKTLFFASGIERVSAIILHIGLSLLIYNGLKQCKKKIVAMAFGIHFAVDFVSVVSASVLSVWLIEVIVFVFAATTFIFAYRLNKGKDVNIQHI